MKTIQKLLVELKACEEAREWAESKSVEEIINQCHRGDWLIWLAREMNLSVKLLTLAKARCAKTVMHLMTERSIDAVLTAERFGLTDEVSFDDLKMAAAEASRAGCVSRFANFASLHAGYAAVAVFHPMLPGNAAEISANTVYHAANFDDGIHAKIENQMQTANICRETFGKELIELINSKLSNN